MCLRVVGSLAWKPGIPFSPDIFWKMRLRGLRPPKEQLTISVVLPSYILRKVTSLVPVANLASDILIFYCIYNCSHVPSWISRLEDPQTKEQPFQFVYHVEIGEKIPHLYFQLTRHQRYVFINGIGGLL